MLCFLAALGAAFLVGMRLTSGPIPFDRARWDAPSSDWQDTTRHRMADGLIESRTLIGLSRTEIVKLLGEPSQSPYFQPEWDLEYVLGIERGFFIRIDSEHLVIRLSSGGRATAAGLARD